MSELVNPYASNAAFTALEASVLFEYLKLSQHMKKLVEFNQRRVPIDQVVASYRLLEKKMGLVLTLYKASVWATITEQQEEAEEEASRASQQREQEASRDRYFNDDQDDDPVMTARRHW